MSLHVTPHAIDRYLERVERCGAKDLKHPTNRVRARTQLVADLEGCKMPTGYKTAAVVFPAYTVLLQKSAVLSVLRPDQSHFLPSDAVIDMRNHAPRPTKLARRT